MDSIPTVLDVAFTSSLSPIVDPLGVFQASSKIRRQSRSPSGDPFWGPRRGSQKYTHSMARLALLASYWDNGRGSRAFEACPLVLRGISVDKDEFCRARQYLGKSQRELANLLGVSVRAVQSFEQGWRPVPVHVERQILFLLAMKNEKDSIRCWEVRDCPEAMRKKCPAWEFRAGNLCWFINGTICRGSVHRNWKEKIALCRECQVFSRTFESFQRKRPEEEPPSPSGI